MERLQIGMKGYKIPIFQRGNLLTQEMLDAMKCYMLDVSAAVFAEYADGIISGMQVSVSDGIVTVGKGLVKYKDTLVVVSEDTVVPVKEKNTVQIVKLMIADKETGTEFETIDVDIVADSDIEKKENEIEICRMKLQNGASLRSHYLNFEDMSTEFDTVQLIYADWAACKSKSIHPQILEQFAKEARAGGHKEAVDICFLQQIYGIRQGACRRELITFYLEEKLGTKREEYSNEDIYNGLCKALRQLKAGVASRRPMREMRELRTVLVD